MKKIKVFANYLNLSSAKKEAKKQLKLLSNDVDLYPGAKVEIINALKLWKTNNWSQKNPYNLPYPTENDYLVCITYVEAQVIEFETMPLAKMSTKMAKKQNKTQKPRRLSIKQERRRQRTIELILPGDEKPLRFYRKLRLAS